MAEHKLHLEVVTPRRQVLTDDVDAVTLPGSMGELQAFANHRPLLTTLGPGRFIVTNAGHSDTYYVAGGFAEVLPNLVRVLADECTPAGELDRVQIQQALDVARAALEAKKNLPIEELKDERLAVERAEAQLRVAGS